MLGQNRKRKYSSISFDGETVSHTPSAVEEPTIDEIESDLNETEDTVEETASEVAADRKETEPQKSVEPRTEELKADISVDETRHRDDGSNLAKTIRSKIDLENERKVKQILRLEQSHELDYSSLLSAFVNLFDNFNKLRNEYGTFRKSVNDQRRIAAYNGQHGFAPSWN